MSLTFFLCLSPAMAYAANPDAMAEAVRLNAVAATVRVLNPAEQTKGGGVIVPHEGPFVYVLTASHVVARAQEVDVQVLSADPATGPVRLYRGAAVVARVEGIDDLALVRIATRDRMPGHVGVCPPDQLPGERGVPVLVVGWSGGPSPTCHPDRADKKRVRRGDGTAGTLWQTSQPNAAGRSGGPLIDRQGRLLGIASGTNDGKGYFCHIETIHGFLRQNGCRFLYEEVKK